MTNSQRLANVRKAFQHWLAEHAGSAAEDGGDGRPESRLAGESILIRGGFYCGRRLDASTHHAVWFVEEDELKVYEATGQLVCSMQTGEISRWAAQQRHAEQQPEAVASASSEIGRAGESENPNVLSMQGAPSQNTVAHPHGESSTNRQAGISVAQPSRRAA